MHSMRLKRYGDVHRTGAWVRSETGLCTVEGCGKKHCAKGLCQMHYRRLKVHGSVYRDEQKVCERCSTEFLLPYKSQPLAVRFCSHECRYAQQLEDARNDPERFLAIRAWREKNPHQFKSHLLKRQAWKRGVESSLVTGRDLRRLLARFDNKCAYCGVREHEHFDHVVPFARGGRHSIGNLLPSCATCNGSKGAKLLAEWRLLKPLPKRFRARSRIVVS